MGRLTPKDKDYIKNNPQLTNKELAEILKHDRHTIGRYKEKLGIAFTQTHNFFQYNDYIVNNYDNKTSRELAQEIGCSKEYVTKIWRESGLKGKSTAHYHCNYNFFENIDSANKAYIIGFIASDGNLYKRDGHQGQIQITLHLKDKQILEDILKVIESNHPIKTTKTTCTIAFVSDKMYNDLINIGLSERKTWNLHIEKIFQNIPKKYWGDFIHGYIDGDGTIYVGKTISASSVSIAIPKYSGEIFVDKINELTNENFRFYEDKRSNYYKLPFGMINSINTTQKYLLLKLMYANSTISLKRKENAAKQIIKNIEDNITNRKENKTAVIKWGELLENLKW